MNKYFKGMLAGLVATVVLSVLMIMKSAMGVMPDVNIITMLASRMGDSMVMGWVMHFMIGVFGYGLAYTLVFSKLAFGNDILRGVMLGVAGWFFMMIGPMPMMGAGLFGMGLASGMMVPVATMMLHVVFGAVLGYTYNKLSSIAMKSEAMAISPHPH